MDDGVKVTSPSQARLKLQIGIYVLGRAVSGTGDWIYIVALNILVLHRTGSAFDVAGLWMIPYLAHFVVSGWSGSISDRVNQRWLLIISDVVRAITIGAIPFVSSIWSIYALIFVANAVGVFFGQAAMPFMTRLVPDQWRKRVNGIVGSFRSGAMLVGPAIAGALMFIGSASFAIWADAVSFFISAITLFLLPNLGSATRHTDEDRDEARDKDRDTVRRSLLQHVNRAYRGLRKDWSASYQFLREQKLLMTILVGTGLTVILAESANSVEVVFAQDALHLGKVGYSTMVLCAGIGVLAGSIIVTALAHKLSTRLLFVGGFIITNVTYLLYACSIGLWTASGTLVALGLFNSAMNVGQATFLQASMPPERMGRVMGALGPPVSLLTILAIGLTGLMTGPVPVRTVMLVLTAGSTAIAVISSWLMLRPKHRAAFVMPGESNLVEAATPLEGGEYHV